MSEVFDLVKKACFLPQHLSNQNVSEEELLDDISFSEGFDQISLDMVQSFLDGNPDLVEQWVAYSEDQRCSPSWYIETTPATVGYYDGQKSKVKEFKEVSAACSYFIMKKIFSVKEDKNAN